MPRFYLSHKSVITLPERMRACNKSRSFDFYHTKENGSHDFYSFVVMIWVIYPALNSKDHQTTSFVDTIVMITSIMSRSALKSGTSPMKSLLTFRIHGNGFVLNSYVTHTQEIVFQKTSKNQNTQI